MKRIMYALKEPGADGYRWWCAGGLISEDETHWNVEVWGLFTTPNIKTVQLSKELYEVSTPAEISKLLIP